VMGRSGHGPYYRRGRRRGPEGRLGPR
jgi:hypothetical protein